MPISKVEKPAGTHKDAATGMAVFYKPGTIQELLTWLACLLSVDGLPTDKPHKWP